MLDSIDRMWRRLVLALGRGIITLIDDTGATQTLQVQLSAAEVRDNTPRLAEYGFQSSPPPGADAALLFLGGERTAGVVIATGHRTYRLTGLAEGEVAISDDKGQKVYLSAAGIRINGGGLPVQLTNTPSVLLDAPNVHMTGALQVDGAITSSTSVTAPQVFDQSGAKSMAGMRAAYNAHHHGTSPTTDTPM
jgi:phage baseplate assembly protein V